MPARERRVPAHADVTTQEVPIWITDMADIFHPAGAR